MATSPHSAALGPDELYDALSNDRRRACVHNLADAEDWVRVKELAESIANDTAADPESAVESTYISLIQIHLPKLDDYGIVDYDEDEKLVTTGAAYEQTIDCLQHHAGEAETTDQRLLAPVLFGVSALALLVALVLPSVTTVVVGVVVAIQLAGIVVALRDDVSSGAIERTREWSS